MNQRVEQLFKMMEKRLVDSKRELEFAQVSLNHLREELDTRQLKLPLGGMDEVTETTVRGKKFIGRDNSRTVPAPF